MTKTRIIRTAAIMLAATLLTGCIGLSIGGGPKTEVEKATVGQQLVDLQKARDTGAINEAEYNAQKAKILNYR